MKKGNFFPPFCFTRASAGTSSWTCISPCPAEHVNTEAQTQAVLSADLLGDEEKVCLRCWHLVFAVCPEHRTATGVNLHTTHFPDCNILLPALCAMPGWQGKVTAPSSVPKVGKAPATLLKPPQAEAAVGLHSNTSSIQSSATELGNTRRAWKTSSCVIRHSSSGMRAHNSTRVSSTGFKGTHALKFPADSGLLFALPSQPRPEALKAFQANPGVSLGLAALVCICAALCGCSWESDGGIFAIY